MADIFKEIVPSILQTNEYILSDDSENSYIPFLVNRSLSYHVDCFAYAQEMNSYPSLDKKLQYDYLFYSIKKYKRPFKKWIKSDIDENIKLVMQYYNFSRDKAIKAISLLSAEQIKIIKESLDQGGLKN